MFYFFIGGDNLDAKIVTVLLLLITDNITEENRSGGLGSSCEPRTKPRDWPVVSVTFSLRSDLMWLSQKDMCCDSSQR